MKKIAILTQPLFVNYGGILQAYALQKALIKLGYEVVTIDRDYYTYPKLWRLISAVKRGVKKLFREEEIPAFGLNDLNYISRYTMRFVNNHINISKLLDTDEKMIKFFKKNHFYAIIVGSDQTWRPKYSPNIYNFYFDFLKNQSTKKIAYASSFGTDIWEYDEVQTKYCKELVQKFDGVSVREDSAVDLCNQYFEINPKLVLDPTLLLDKKYYIDLLDDKHEDKTKGQLFTYILDEDLNKKQVISEVSRKRQIISFKHQSKESLKKPKGNYVEDYVMPPVEGWIKGFYNASFVITDSFHGVIFSIIFNKSFIAIGNEERGITRFTSLLKQLDLEHRLILNKENLNEELIMSKIDFDTVNEKLKMLKEKSMLFLENNLKKC
jgi:flavodoxin